MLIEDQSTKCPNCKQPLTWLSHVKRYPQPEAIHEFNFRCESCSREYQFKEGQLGEKALEGNLGVEDEESNTAASERALESARASLAKYRLQGES
jgi:C4-type Zn-finger protein